MRDLGEAVSGAVDSDQAGLVVDALVSRGIRCVAFDMDQTVVSKHSMGRLERGRFEWFLSHVTPGFKALVPKLSAAGGLPPFALPMRSQQEL